LKSAFPHFIWVGFYQISGGELTVGPYQGAPACLVLERHRGVCWAGIDRADTVVVPDVHAFPGHIVCDERASSEVVIPVIDGTGWICGVLDVDSSELDAFVDTRYLREIAGLVHGRRESMPAG
jgi:GAF domain-containing protein